MEKKVYEALSYDNDFDIDLEMKNINFIYNSNVNNLHKELHTNPQKIRSKILETRKTYYSNKKSAIIRKGLQVHFVDGFYIPINYNWKKIAINLSGGADSACLAFILCKIIIKNNWRVQIDVITHSRVWQKRPWASVVSVNVYNKLREMFPDIISARFTNYIPPELEYASLGHIVNKRSGDQIAVDSFNNYLANVNGYNAIYNATTKNPSTKKPIHGRMANRDFDLQDIRLEDLVINRKNYWILLPLKIVEKDWIVKQYIDNDYLDLFAITRSCEGDEGVCDPDKKFLTAAEMCLAGMDYDWFKNNQTAVIPTCGECFWCHERKWAMEKNNLEL